MRIPSFLILNLLTALSTVSAVGQNPLTTLHSPAVVEAIDGSKTPELIPDSFAYRMVLLSFTTLGRTDSNANTKLALRMRALGLLPEDETILKQLMNAFGSEYEIWRTNAQKATQLGTAAGSISDRDMLVSKHRNNLNHQLSPDGAAKLSI